MDTIYLIMKVLAIIVMMFLSGNFITKKETRELFALASYLLMGVGVVGAVIRR